MGVTKHIDTRMRWTWSKNLPTTLSPPPNSSSTVLTAWLEEMGINIKFSSFRNLVSVSGTALDHSGYTGEKKQHKIYQDVACDAFLAPGQFIKALWQQPQRSWKWESSLEQVGVHLSTVQSLSSFLIKAKVDIELTCWTYMAFLSSVCLASFRMKLCICFKNSIHKTFI